MLPLESVVWCTYPGHYTPAILPYSLQPASDSMPRVIERVNCGRLIRTTRSAGGRVGPGVDDATDTETVYIERDGENVHLLRCEYDLVDQPSVPDHEDDFAVECSESFCVL